ncbi:glycosyltransferase family 4 protein [Vibrio vulnificus]|uniref:glycosyltransferase family 4 protein n=1 Tax=Vibrio vulnificus TaxID=672 RepID=UPI001EEA4DFE|nr:glycosyltransferase family 4 protein [Vibrio vulnificus]MCG6305668.1 glycosyltransferase family 4 protein [Vibrio vulnificus]
MKKVLFVATVDQHIRHFHIPYIKWFKGQGHHVSVASRGNECVSDVDTKYEVSFERTPWSLNNFFAFRNLLRILKENKFDLIHTHTPVASILVRVANLLMKNRAKVIYTAHGFHFYKGAKLLNWFLYFPVEKLLSYCTDSIITINNEDYEFSLKNFGCKNIYLVDGVGVDLNKFTPASFGERNSFREKLNLSVSDFVLIYVGELSKRKNQKLLLDSISKLNEKLDGFKLLLVGKGNEEEYLKERCSLLGIQDKVMFLGYRNDIDNLMKLSDLSVSTALQEGLPVNVMESLSTGLPCIVTNCRGNRDIISNMYNGIVVEHFDSELISDAIYQLFNDQVLLEKMKKNALVSSRKYSEDTIMKTMIDIYSKYIGHDK